MKIQATIKQAVDIDPLDAIKQILYTEAGASFLDIRYEDDKYYLILEDDFGHGFVAREEEISKEKYEFINSLITCYKYLKK